MERRTACCGTTARDGDRALPSRRGQRWSRMTHPGASRGGHGGERATPPWRAAGEHFIFRRHGVQRRVAVVSTLIPFAWGPARRVVPRAAPARGRVVYYVGAWEVSYLECAEWWCSIVLYAGRMRYHEILKHSHCVQSLEIFSVRHKSETKRGGDERRLVRQASSWPAPSSFRASGSTELSVPPRRQRQSTL